MALTKIDDRGLKTPIDLLDNEKIRFGTGNDLEIFHDGTNNKITSTNGDIHIESSSSGSVQIAKGESEYIARFLPDSSVQLYYDNSKTFQTTSYGAEVIGTFRCDALSLLDNEKIQLGSSGTDLEIYHDGSSSYIENDTGNLKLSVAGGSNTVEINKGTVSEHLAKFIADGAVSLYYDNSKKLETKSWGVEIPTDQALIAQGSSAYIKVQDSGKFYAGNDEDLQIYHDGTFSYLANSTGNLYIRNGGGSTILIQPLDGEDAIKAYGNGRVELAYDHSKKLETSSNGVVISGRVQANSSTDSYPIRSYNSSTSASAKTGINLQLERNASAVQFDAVRLIAGKRQEWTGVPSTVDSYFAAEVINNESMVEKIRVDNDGLKFNGDTAAANGLDDYEEGTFNPAVQGSTSAGTGSNSAIEGHYTKIGNLVHIDIYINQTSHNGTGDVRITTPFTCKTGAQVAGSVLFDNVDFDSNFRTIASHIWGGSSLLAFYGTSDDASWGAIPMSGNLDSSVRYILSLTYPVA